MNKGKALFFSILTLVVTAQVAAEFRYDPINDRFCSLPMAPDVNQLEYHNLVLDYMRAERREQQFLGQQLGLTWRQFTNEEWRNFRNFYYQYLMRVGTSTAFRFIDDLKTSWTFGYFHTYEARSRFIGYW